METEIQKAARALKRGEPIIFPTETVYGLAAPVFHEEAVRKIFKIKGRPSDNPLIAHISSIGEAKRLSDDLPEAFYLLAEKFWPGPLAIIVKKRKEVPDIVSAGLPTIAIRMPNHPIARELIREVGEPLVAPSANLSGRPSPTTLQDAQEDLDLFGLDGGACDVGIESTVISLFHNPPMLLRPGKITKEELERALGVKVVLPPKNSPAFSPGMKYRHYAPKAKLHLVYDQNKLGKPFIEPSAKTFYRDLRLLDRQHIQEMQIYCSEVVLKDAALMNRILRASGEK